MRRCAPSSQRSTCPPSAAVRQRSIADMTLSWPRLTWRHGRHAKPVRGGGRYPPPRPPAVTTAARPSMHFWTRSKQPWITLPEDDQTFETQPG